MNEDNEELKNMKQLFDKIHADFQKNLKETENGAHSIRHLYNVDIERSEFDYSLAGYSKNEEGQWVKDK